MMLFVEVEYPGVWQYKRAAKEQAPKGIFLRNIQSGYVFIDTKIVVQKNQYGCV
jgi:hypothetical protein